ncbi:MAG TPA: hypothetical protein VG144_03895 [Gaiellaceae bacterium]|nr:hypothetical protein [Gaiellaceae bacterium]
MRRTLALRQKRAVQRAYRRHGGDVYRYALAVLGDPGDAEAVVDRTFLRAYLRRRREKRTRLHLNDLLAIAHELCRRRAATPEPVSPQEDVGTFVCEHAELAISLKLDDRLSRHELRFLRSHLRICRDCEQFDRSLRKQRAALRALAAMPVPETVAPSGPTWLRVGATAERKFLPARASP